MTPRLSAHQALRVKMHCIVLCCLRVSSGLTGISLFAFIILALVMRLNCEHRLAIGT